MSDDGDRKARAAEPGSGQQHKPEGETSRWLDALSLAELVVQAVGGVLALAGRVVAWTVGLIMSSCS